MSDFNTDNSIKFEDKSFFQKFLWSKIHKGNFNTLELKDNMVTVTTYHVFKPKIRTTSINISDISFFDSKGIFSKEIIMGYHESVSFKHLKDRDCKKIIDYLISNGSKFCVDENNNSKKFISTGLKIFSKEFIQITDKAIIHSFKGFFSMTNSYIPFDKIDFALFSSSGFMKKKLCTIGELSFITKKSFASKDVKEIYTAIKSYANVAEGKRFKPSIFSGVKKRNQIQLIFLDDGIFFCDFRDKKQSKAFFIRKVETYKCKPVFSLFKRVVYINGMGTTDLRNKSAISISIKLPGVFFFSWGKIKKQIKRFYK